MPKISDEQQKLIDAPLIPIHTKIKGKHVRIGHVMLDTFYKTIDGTRHMLHSPTLSIAFSIASIEQAKSAGAKHLNIFDKANGIKYTSTIENLESQGFKVERHGFEPQIALPIEKWNREGGETKAKPAFLA